MHIGIADSNEKENWNAFVVRYSDSEFLQSWEWGEFQRSYGRRVWRFTVRQDDILVGVGMAICMEIRRGLHYVYVPRGPIVKAVLSTDQKLVIWSLFTQQWRLIGLESNALFIRVEPPQIERVEKKEKTLRVQNFLLKRGWISVKRVQPHYTTIISLKDTEETILSRMHSKTRYNVRLSEKKDLTFRLITTEKDFKIFWDLHSKAAKRDNFMTYPYEYYRKLFNILLDEEEKPDTRRSASRVFIVEKRDGTPLVAALIITFGKKVVYLFGGSDIAHRNLMAPYLLHWSIIKRGKKNGFEEYDLWGITAPGEKKEHSWQGFSRFKKGFGGDEYMYPGAYDFPYSNIRYQIYTLLKKIRRIL